MIITDEKILREKSQPAKPEEVAGIISALEKELLDYERLGKGRGIGLSAPQIGIRKQVAIIRINREYLVNLVNCKIEHAYDPITFDDEGCLSLPGKVANTKRFNEIHVINNLVEPHAFTATGLLSICVQHEIDHWNGILFEDHIIKPIIKQAANENCACGSIDEKTKKPKKYKKCCGRKS
jgi:peptide deformylase